MNSSSIRKMRREIASVYPGKNWRYKCFYVFKPDQVIAIHKSMTEKGMFSRKLKQDGIQISIWDLGIDI